MASGLLTGSSMLLSGHTEASRPLPAAPQRSQPAAPRQVLARAAGKLDKTNRLWELDTTWYPGAEAPAYLDGTLAGDRGFDPLKLGQNPDLLPWLVEGELYNGRVAMLAVVGILFTEAIGKGPWWTAPARADWPLSYWPGVVLSHAVYALFEAARWKNFQTKGETGALNMVPFDPMGFRSDHTRQSEVRNGRLAMIATVGFASQAANTKEGPLDNLYSHVADPVHNNIFASAVAPEITLAVVAITLTPIVYEAFRVLEDPEKKKAKDFSPIPFL